MEQMKPKILESQIQEALNRKQNGAYGFIYVTTNLLNGKRYCGQKAYGCDSHWKSYLGSGTQLTMAVAKYGKENFSREIIEYGYSKQELDQLEMKWIAHYGAVFDDNWYNIGFGGHYNCNRGEDSWNAALTEAQVKEIIERLLNGEFPVDIAKDYGVAPSIIGRIRNHKSWTHLTKDVDFEINHKVHSPVVQYDFSGNAVGRYSTIQSAANALGIRQGVISGACNGVYKTAAGYIWKHERDAVDKISEDELKRLTTSKPSSRVRAVCQYDLDGKFLQKYDNCVEAGKAVNINSRNICSVINGKHKTAAGFIWKVFDGSTNDLSYDEVEYYTTVEGSQRVVQFNFDGERIKEYMSAASAAKKLNISFSGILNACEGIYKQSGGFIWKYANQAPDHISENELFALLQKKDSPYTKEICQFDLRGNLIKIHHSLAHAAKEFDTTAATIQGACVGNSKTSCGFIWRYRERLIGDCIPQEEIVAVNTRKVSTKNRQPVRQLDTNGNVIAEFSSVKAAGLSVGVGSDAISHVCRGVNKTAGGFRWEYCNKAIGQ